ncbi:MAG: hypothetical protein QXI19_14140 [Candidatus Caldarchaeum sp.]
MKPLTAFFACLAFSLNSLAQHPRAETPPLALQALRKVLEAQKTIRYAGVRVVYLMRDGERARVTEFVRRQGLSSRTEYPEDPILRGVVVVEHRGHRLEFIPQLNEIRRSPSARERTLQLLHRLREALLRGEARVDVFQGGSVAGRPTLGITITDGAGTIGQRLWIDMEHGLILKHVLYGRDGVEVGGFEFLRVNLDPPPFPPDLFELRREGARVVDVETDFQVGWNILKPQALPREFIEVRAYLRRIGQREVMMHHYTDGIRHISIFQSPGANLPLSPPVPPPLHLVTIRKEGYWLAAIGNVDPHFLRRTLESMR